jgi:hypothetical protein
MRRPIGSAPPQKTEACVVAGTVPIKTPEGLAELTTRQRHVSQRHRTVLLLVDGKRSAVEVRSMALLAGVPESCFDDLLGLGLIMLPEPTFSFIVEDAPIEAEELQVDLHLPGPDSVGAHADSMLPASCALAPESVSADSMADESPQSEPWPTSELAAPDAADRAFAEARTLLMRAVRSEAPVSGSLTLLRLRRSQTRGELNALLDEVETRISKPHRVLAAAQTLRRVRQLLAGRVDSTLEPA